MGWLPIFVDEQDTKVLIHWLNQQEEIAYLIPVARGNWKAVTSVTNLQDGDYSLWHIPSGALPLWDSNSYDRIIENPWEGWTETLTGSSLSSPKSGINCPGIFSLTLNTRHQPYSQLERTKGSMLKGQLMQGKNILSVSDFQWIGNRYRAASPQTQRWWKRLKYWVAHHAVKLTPPRVRWSYWAFPSAFCKLKSGMDYCCQGWDLTIPLREAHQKKI